MDEIFLRDVPTDLKLLAESIRDSKWKKAQRLAHSIKGASRTVGVQRLGAIAEQLEYLCKQQDAPSAKKELKIIESEVTSAIEHITEGQGDT